LPARPAPATRWNGRSSRLTAAEIESVRILYDAVVDLRRQRTALCVELGISLDEFSAYGRRVRGKKPRQPFTSRPETTDWVAATDRSTAV
jgi:hypothetical protein